MTAPISATMQAVVLHSYQPDRFDVQIEERPVPQPGAGEVLVKLLAAPINPSDLMFMQGRYGFSKPTPVVPGFEGVGRVVAAGSGIFAQRQMGKRVIIASRASGDGTWREYAVIPAWQALGVPDDMPDEQAAMMAVNPMSAVVMVDLARKYGTRALIQDAAGSALGRMMIRLCQHAGISLINIVRRADQLAELQKAGATYVLDSTAPDFEEQLRALAKQLDAHVAFDAIGGSMAACLLRNMPRHSRVIVYGGLGDDLNASAPISSLIFRAGSIEGFWLSDHISPRNPLKLLSLWNRAYRDVSKGNPQPIRARFPLSKALEAITDYNGQMSGGKVLLVAD